MKRRTVSLMLIVAGVLVLVLAIASATVLRPADSASPSLAERPDVPLVISEAGVLEAVDETVTVRARAGEDEVVTLAVGRTVDVEGWTGDTAHVRITGLSSWEELTGEVVAAPEAEPTDAATDAATPPATEGATTATAEPTAAATTEPTGAATAEPTGAATAEPTEAATAEPTGAATAEPGQAQPELAGSDLWVVEATATGTVELEWTHVPGRWSLIAATSGDSAPEVELEWGRETGNPFLVPGLVLGGLLLLAGAVLLVLEELAARESRRTSATPGSRWTPEGAGPLATSPPTATEDAAALTRRQLRERDRVAAQQARSGAAVPPPVPLAPGAEGTAEDGDGATADDGPAHDGRTTTGPDRADDEPVDVQDDAPGAVGDPDHGSEDHGDGDPAGDDPPAAEQAPSWRSVWGFGAAPAGKAGTTPTVTDGADPDAAPAVTDDAGPEDAPTPTDGTDPEEEER